MDGGQHLDRRRRPVELACAMVRHHDAVDTHGRGAGGIVGMHDALEHELAGPQPPEGLDVLPQHGGGHLRPDKFHHLGRSRAARRICLPVRQHRLTQPRVLGHPGRMQARLQLGLEGELQGPHEAVATVALAVGADRHVDGYHQRREPGAGGAAHHVLGNLAVARDVELIPAVLGRQPAQVLDQPRGRAGHDEGDVGFPGCLGQHHVAAAPEQRGTPGRRNPDRARVGPAEQRRALIPDGHVDAVARHQRVLLEGILVAGEPVLVVEAALDEVVGDLGQPALGQLAQVVEIDGGIDPGGQGGCLQRLRCGADCEADPVE